MKLKVSILVLVVFIIFAGCRKEEEIIEYDELVVYSPHPLEFIDPIVGEFENETGITVKVIVAGTGELLNRIKSETYNVNCDVLWGGSLSTLRSETDLFEKYLSKNEKYAIFKNKEGYITRFTMVPSVIMINTNLVGDISINGYSDLLKKELKGKIAYANPSKSSSSFEQLINQLNAMGNRDIEEGWKYIEKLIINLDNELLDSSSEVYNGVVEGKYTVGLTFEEPAAMFLKSGAPVKIVYPKEGTIIRPDGISIIRNAKNYENATKFVDFLTSKNTQRLISTELNRRSIRNDIKQADNLYSLDKMDIIKDDGKWASENKDLIISRYLKLFNEISENQ